MKFDNLRRWELLAVAFSLTYTILITYDSIWCWPFALAGALIYLILCFQRRIYAESALQFFYLLTGVYGWFNWGDGLSNKPDLLGWEFHGIAIASGAVAVYLTGFLLKRYTDAARPYVDSFTSVFSILATLLMINLYSSNWAYFIVIDLVSVFLYYTRQMYFTSGLFVIYTILSINGLLQWTSF